MMRKKPVFVIGVLIPILFSCNHAEKEIKSVTPENIGIENNGVRIAYTDTGKGDTVLLFVHGWCINKTYWSDQTAHFKNRYRVVTVDLPGFGQSGKNRNVWTTQAFGSDIDTVMSALNLSHVILIGHSMSGDIILEAALHARARVMGIVGVDNFKGFGGIPTKAEKEEEAKAIDLLRHNFKQIAFQYFNEGLFSKTTTDSVKKRVLNDVANADTVIAVACMEHQDYDEVKMLKETKMKLFLINSDVNPTDTSGFAKNKIPYQIFYIHGTGHFPMIENPNAFNDLLGQVIAGMNN